MEHIRGRCPLHRSGSPGPPSSGEAELAAPSLQGRRLCPSLGRPPVPASTTPPRQSGRCEPPLPSIPCQLPVCSRQRPALAHTPHTQTTGTPASPCTPELTAGRTQSPECCGGSGGSPQVCPHGAMPRGDKHAHAGLQLCRQWQYAPASGQLVAHTGMLHGEGAARGSALGSAAPPRALQRRGPAQREASSFSTDIIQLPVATARSLPVASLPCTSLPPTLYNFQRKMKMKSMQIPSGSGTCTLGYVTVSANHRTPCCSGCLGSISDQAGDFNLEFGHVLNLFIFHWIHLGIIPSYLN